MERNRNGRIVIIDGNSLINRAYYAMQRPMITKGGLYTHGVYGFLNMLTKIFKDYEPEYIGVTFDRKAPTFRHLEYDAYKAGRKKMSPELAMQLPLLKDVLAAMNIKMLEIDGFEADDIIGTVTKRAEEEGLEPYIITGDKDELQLASDITKVIITRKGISEFEMYDRQAMIDKYGFTPEQFIDFKGLMGDQSDNIPGLPGVGEKTATKLILEYGSVENLIASTDSMPAGKLKDKIEENAPLAVMSKRLATINTSVPIEIDFDEFKTEEPDYDALIEIYKKLEFNSFLKKMKYNGERAAAVSDTETSAEKLKEKQIEKIIVTGNEALSALAEDAENEGEVVIKVLSDNSHTSLPFIYGMGILVKNKFYYIDGTQRDFMRDAASLLVSSAGKKCIGISGHDLKRDYYALMSVFEDCLENERESLFYTKFDTAVAAYLLEPSRSSYSIKVLAYEYFHEEIEEDDKFISENSQIGLFGNESDKFCDYCLRQCCIAEALTDIFKNKIENEQLENVLYEAELPLIEILAHMEVQGFKVDKNELNAIGSDISAGIEKISSEIYELAGENFNINSPQQLGNILFEKLELPAGKKTKKGYSTNAEILEKLRDKHPIIDLILEYRMLSKLKSTYIDGLIPLIAEDGKIHAHFQQTVTATGRISCTEPNLQNIPIRQELGRTLRKAFTPYKSEDLLTGADYSQIELRVLAHLSGDEHLKNAFNAGEDIHRSTAAKVFDVPQDEVTPQERSAAKAVNFGVIYGMSSFGLSSEINVSRKEAERYISEYFKRFPDVKEFMDKQVEDCRRQGYLETMLGRRRYIPEISASSYMVRQLGERLAMNSPIQGSAADIIKLAMIAVYRKLRSEKLASKLILQVHDELIIETAAAEKETVALLLKECMENVMNIDVKLSVSVSSGGNWYELK
ncbi:MAG: DNA polymerase I [Firmicutes bacterium]|nr:DNA polymerase I [Bacillota bacterium]